MSRLHNVLMGTIAACSENDRTASVLRWWRDAGIDMVIDESPRQWLAPAVATPPRQAIENGAQSAGAIPVFDTLAALTTWLLTADTVPEAGPPNRRVAPSGNTAGDAAGGLMIIADCPDQPDLDAGFLLAGALAPLFDKMLAALGRNRQSAYLTALCPGRPPRGLVSEAAFATLAPIARRHVELVAPKQLWLLGSAASRAILGMGDIEAHGKLHSINLNGAMIDVVVTSHPRFLTDRDRKLRAWTEMQRLIEMDIS